MEEIIDDDPPQVRIVATGMAVEDIERATEKALRRHPECTTIEYFEDEDGGYVIVLNLPQASEHQAQRS